MSGKKYVPEGVYLVCDKGTKISRLKSLFYKETTLFSNNMCTSKDKQFMVNFDTFGTCATCNNCPCTAPVTDWTNVTDQISIGNNTLLLEDSELPCTKGGTIKIFYYKKNALANLPKKKKGFWDFFTEVAEVQRDFSVGFAKGLWKGLKGTVTAVADLAVWAGKHTTIYQMANPAGYAEQLQKDAEMVKKLGSVAKKAGTWMYRNSTINMITDPNDYALAQAENAQMMDKLVDKAKNMNAEDWGSFAGQVAFEVGLEVATAGGAAALTAAKVADKGLDAVRAIDKLEDLRDVGDALKDFEKLEEIADGANTVRNIENLDDFKPLELGDVTYHLDNVFDYTQYQMKKGEKLGDFGEDVVEDMLRKEGYTDFYRVQNNSGNGVDIVAKKDNGDILKAEVKSTKQDRLWNEGGEPKEIPLKGDQKTMGGEDYTTDRLNRASNGEDGYTDGRSTPEAERAMLDIREARANGNSVQNKKYDVYVDKNGKLRSNPVERTWEKP